MKKILAALAVLFFAGPSHAETTTVTAPNGAQILRTKCKSDTAECYQEARQTCRGSYQILGSESHAGGLIWDAMPGPVTWYSMSYQCGKSDGRFAEFPFHGGVYVPPRLHTNFCDYNYTYDYGTSSCVGVY